MSIKEKEFKKEVENFVDKNYGGSFSVLVDIDEDTEFGSISISYDPEKGTIPRTGYAEILREYADLDQHRISGVFDDDIGEYRLAIESRDCSNQNYEFKVNQYIKTLEEKTYEQVEEIRYDFLYASKTEI